MEPRISTCDGRQARPSGVDRLMNALPYTTLTGFIGVVVVLLLGFEQPNPTTLVVAAILLLSAPVGMIVHLSTTTELSGPGKRLWWKSMLGKDLWLFNAYFRPEERRAATSRLSQAGERKDG